jgi:hypothetical protein
VNEIIGPDRSPRASPHQASCLNRTDVMPQDDELPMPKRALCLAFVIVLAAGCAGSRVPETGFGDRQALERAIMSYYERHATEENRTCLSPFMYGLTRVDVVEEQPERLVLDVRYLYRDRNKDDRGDGLGRECSNYGERRFTLDKDGAGFEVLEMTGPQRTAGMA